MLYRFGNSVFVAACFLSYGTCGDMGQSCEKEEDYGQLFGAYYTHNNHLCMVNPLDALRLRLINASAHSNETFDTQKESRLDGRQTNT